MRKTRSLSLSFGPLLFCLAVGCGPGTATVKGNGGGGGGTQGEDVPQVEYIGPNNPNPAASASPELLFSTPTRPFGDLGTIRVNCPSKGCLYNTASASMGSKAREIGASGVHSIRESSGKVNDPMESVASKNGRVYVLAGTAFAYSP